MLKKEITTGFTNKSFKDGNKFVQKIIKNQFNHNFDYNKLAIFGFVPQLLKQTPKKLVWKFIKGKTPLASKTTLTQIGEIMKKTHLSSLELPRCNILQRAEHYLKIISDKQIHVPEIFDNFVAMSNIMKNMGKLVPVHNDVWPENLIEDKNGKIWLVDWEYATMGDQHFDLACFIESSLLNAKQEAMFLKAYKNYESGNYAPYQEKLLPKYKKLVNYLTLLWMHAQDQLPFSDKKFKIAMNK